MMRLMKAFIREITLLWANRSHACKHAYLTKQGAVIGEGTRFNCGVKAFGTEPYLITVGKNCLFAEQIRLMTHDGAITVLNNLDYFAGKRLDKIAPIHIGDNVYIGTGAYVMPGVVIGSNVIIGAGAVVTKTIPDNSVAVGVPARVIKSIEQYHADMLGKAQLYPTAGMPFEKKRQYFKDNLCGQQGGVATNERSTRI